MLVPIIQNTDSESLNSAEELSNGYLALSTLINFCHKNYDVLFLLMRSINISQFTRKIKDHGMLATKLLILLSEDQNSPSEKELHSFLRSSFAAVELSTRNWNVTQLRHVVEFLLDSKEHMGLHKVMLNYEHYCEDIEKLLNVSLI